MRGFTQEQNEAYATKCLAINVIVYDMVKVAKELSEQLAKMPEHEGKVFELRESKLARVVGQDMITDTECAYYVNIDKGIQLDVYRKGEETVDPETGNKTTQFYMFPVCSVTLSPTDLEEFISEETNLKEFMGERFIYNHRIVGNIDNMISNFK